jgi:hypothetical protein
MYRVIRPLTALHEVGYPTSWGHIEDIDARMLTRYDAVFIAPTDTDDPKEIQRVLRMVNARGKVAWLDYDADVLNRPGQLDQVDGTVAALEEAQGVIVSTPTLMATLRPYTARLTVIPSYVDPTTWPETPRASQKLVVGLTGSPSHGADWAIIAEPMRRILARHGETVDFLVAGFLPDYLADLVTLPYAWVPLHHYPFVVNSIDIGLCPRIDDHAARCTSPIQALELSLAGAAVVASPTQYDAIVSGKGMVARTEHAWETAIERYIVDTAKRVRDARNLHTYVTQRWSVRTHVELIADAYRSLYLRCRRPMGLFAKTA